MRKLAAQYIFPLNSAQPVCRGTITLDDEGTIVETGVLEEETESTEFYNGILIPGFVNSHCHIELSHLKGHFSKKSGMAGFIQQIRELRYVTDEAGRYEAIATEMQKMYQSGVSAMADISNSSESFKAKSESLMYTRTFLEVFGSEESDMPRIMSSVRELSKLAKEFGIDAAPTPHSCYTMSPSLLRESSADAIAAGWLSYHNQESWQEEELIIKGSGPLHDDYKSRGMSTPPVKGVPSLLYFLEVIESVKANIDESILLVHNTFTNEESVSYAMERLKSLYWAVCPLSNLFIHDALPPLELLRRLNANITLGTDSLSSNDTLSMVDEINCIHKYFPTIPLKEILEWSSYNGAKFLGIEDKFGSLEKGKRPGIVLVDNIDWNSMKLTEKSKSVRLV
jgi:cytosine/adenosine deaminase-related metal-dependent hydrolase